MSLQTYSAVLPILGFLSLASLLVGIIYLVMAIVGWRGPHRNRRLIRSLMFASAYPITVVLLQVLIHQMVLPTMARESQKAREQRADAATKVNRGDKVPSFRIRAPDGREFAIDELHGKVVLLNFFATWCGPCIAELPLIDEIFKDYQDNESFVLLVIGREETNATVSEFRTKREFSFPIAADTDRAIYGLFAKELIPRTYLIAKDGTICFTATGFSEEEMAALRRQIKLQLAAQ